MTLLINKTIISSNGIDIHINFEDIFPRNGPLGLTANPWLVPSLELTK